jgi:hypothetical protein
MTTTGAIKATVVASDSPDSVSIDEKTQIAVSIKSSLVMTEDMRRMNGCSLFAQVNDRKKDAAWGRCFGRDPQEVGVSAVGVACTSSANIAVGDHVLLLSGHGGLWRKHGVIVPTNIAARLSMKLPPQLASMLPAFVSAYAMLSSSVKDNVNAGVKGSCGRGETVLYMATAAESRGLFASAMEQVGKRCFGINIVTCSDLKMLKAHSSQQKGGAKFNLCISNAHHKAVLRSLNPGGTLLVHNTAGIPPRATPASLSSIEIPVSAAIFEDVKVRGFDLCTWAEEASVLQYRAAVDAAVVVLLAAHEEHGAGFAIASPTERMSRVANLDGHSGVTAAAGSIGATYTTASIPDIHTYRYEEEEEEAKDGSNVSIAAHALTLTGIQNQYLTNGGRNSLLLTFKN